LEGEGEMTNTRPHLETEHYKRIKPQKKTHYLVQPVEIISVLSKMALYAMGKPGWKSASALKISNINNGTDKPCPHYRELAY
jgi:hypothetical protein